MKKMHFIKIEPDGLITLVETEGTLREYQNAVDGYIEHVVIPDFRPEFTMLVNEEGVLMDLRLNPVASTLAHQPIVGNAIVVSGDELKPLEYEVAKKLALDIIQTAWRWDGELAL